MPTEPNVRHSSLSVRLALAFVAVSLLAVLGVAGLAVALGGQGITTMVDDRRSDLTRSLDANAVATYNTGELGWNGADWAPALDLAERNGTNVAVLDSAGRVVAATPQSPLGMSGSQRSPIEVNGTRVGELVVAFDGRGLSESADELRKDLVTAVVGAAGLAATLALVVALGISRRLTAPLLLVIEAAESMRRGVRQVRIGPLRRGPREVRELAATFDSMADGLEEQERLRRGLVADIAHELRTPVAVLQANLEALADGIVPHTPEQTESLHEEVVRLADRVRDLQALAGADAAALNLRPAVCDLAEVARTAAGTMGGADQGRIVLATEPAIVEADVARVHQIVTNLLSNACKFSAPDSPVRLSTGASDGEGWIRVQDEGTGIAEADLPRIFERFWRSEQTSAVAGSGIGLAIVEQLVQAHRGRVQIDSRLGEGTSIGVWLPREHPATAPPVGAPRSPSPAAH